MIKNVIKWLFGIKDNASGETAANRMKLMVIHDRYQLPPAVVEQMKNEMLAVAARYFEIDPESSECVIKSSGNRRAFISAIVPLLKRGNIEDDGTESKTGKKKRAKRKSKKDLSASAA